jgi:hypothetical protein
LSTSDPAIHHLEISLCQSSPTSDPAIHYLEISVFHPSLTYARPRLDEHSQKHSGHDDEERMSHYDLENLSHDDDADDHHYSRPLTNQIPHLDRRP